MKLRSRFPLRAATLGLVAALGVSAPFLTRATVGAPKKELEIWPGRRVLLLLPLAPSATWNADPELGRAIVPLAQPQLQSALTATDKFSITLPYRFDPVLRRGLLEKRIAENEITALLTTPTLATARPVVDKLTFDQPVMIAEIKLEELTVGGTPKAPTVQIQTSGLLYEQGNPNPIKSITVRSRPTSGRTPSERIRAAASQTFTEIAAEFVTPPVAFDLPLPPAPTPTPAKPKAVKGKGNGKNGGANAGANSGANGTATVPATAGEAATPPIVAPAAPNAIAPPNSLSTAPGAPLVPQLPAAQPPLGIAAGTEGTVGR